MLLFNGSTRSCTMASAEEERKGMQCNIAAGQQKAAEMALSISERELQRIKQQGCTTTQQDRSIMRQPDYRALRYPQLSDPIVALEYDTNNKYTAAAQSDGFVHPFVDEPTSQVVQPRPTVPGTTMSGVGDLAAIAGAYLGNEQDEKLSIYQRIADGIRGRPARTSESQPTRQGFVQDLAAEQHGRTVPSNLPVFSEAQVTREMLYGDAGPAATRKLRRGFAEKCRGHCRATLYDLMHYEAITPHMIRSEGCTSKLGFISTRDGRLPYLLFIATLFALVIFVAMTMLRRA